MSINNLIDSSHQPDGFFQSDDNALVIDTILIGQTAISFLPVIKPFVENLVSAYVEPPDIERNVVKVGCSVDVKASLTQTTAPL
jgi:hypothetical protein